MTAIITTATITTDTRPADARLALEEERALQRQREIDGGRKAAIGDIIAASEKLQGLADRSGQGRHGRVLGDGRGDGKERGLGFPLPLWEREGRDAKHREGRGRGVVDGGGQGRHRVWYTIVEATFI